METNTKEYEGYKLLYCNDQGMFSLYDKSPWTLGVERKAKTLVEEYPLGTINPPTATCCGPFVLHYCQSLKFLDLFGLHLYSRLGLNDTQAECKELGYELGMFKVKAKDVVDGDGLKFGALSLTVINRVRLTRTREPLSSALDVLLGLVEYYFSIVAPDTYMGEITKAKTYASESPKLRLILTVRDRFESIRQYAHLSFAPDWAIGKAEDEVIGTIGACIHEMTTAAALGDRRSRTRVSIPAWAAVVDRVCEERIRYSIY